MNTEINIVKFGSNLVTHEQGVDQESIESYAEGLSRRYDNRGLMVVTSGAVATGEQRAKKLLPENQRTELSLKQIAGLGCTAVFNAWESAFEGQGIAAASFPVTHHQLAGKHWWNNVRNRSEKISFRQTLIQNAHSGVVTIINEADALSDIELMKLKCGGDNDGLAAHLAQAVGARSLTLFANLGGIFDDEKNLISIIDSSNIDSVRTMAHARSVSSTGRGGLITKIDAGWNAALAGSEVQVAGVSSDMQGTNATRFVVG